MTPSGSAVHVVSSEGLGVPESSAGAVRLLGAHGVVPAGVTESVALAGWAARAGLTTAVEPVRSRMTGLELAEQ